MIIECSKDTLQDNINIVLKAVTTRTTLPILECILLTADENGFKMMSNDLEMGIETAPIEAVIAENGSVALEAKIFSDIIRRLPGETVKISVLHNNITTIKSGKSEFKIVGLSGEEFPFLPTVEKDTCCVIKSDLLKNMIRQTIFSVAADESKPVFTGELFEIKDGSLNVVAVDGFRVAHRKAAIESDIIHSAVIPAKTLSEINKILLNDESDILMYFTERQVLFEMTDCTVVSRLLEGEFLRYDSVFTEDYTTKVTINCNEFLNALERAYLISARETKKNPVKIEISENNLVISTNTETGTSHEEIGIELDGSDLEISFNPKYLIDVIRVIDEKEADIFFTSPLSPCTIKGLENSEVRYLVLPLRQKN